MTNPDLTFGRMPQQERQGRIAEARLTRRTGAFKIFCALLLGICFWYAVPYSFPLQLDPDPIKAAAGEASAFQGSVSRQIAMPILCLLSAFCLYRLPSRGRLLRSRLLLGAAAYIVWALASVTWSVDPTITRKRLVVFLINVLVAYTLARSASLRELAWLGFVCTGTVACLALWADVILLRDFKPWDPDYRFMGVMTANYQAMNLFVCLACGLTLLQLHPRWVRWLGPMLAIFAGLLFLTRARIGTMLFLAAFFLVSVRSGRRRLRPYGQALLLLTLACVVVPGFIFMAGHSGGSAFASVLMMGRHDTENTASLSNRAPLWSELLDSVRDRPWLGTGFAAFWSPERVERVSLDQGWVVPHAHNTYLDEVLSLGVVGGALYLGILTGAFATACRRYRQHPEPVQLLPVLLLAWVLLLSITESLPVAPYLPTLLAYSCVARMCMSDPEVAEQSGDTGRMGIQMRRRRPLSTAAWGWQHPGVKA